MNPFASDYDDAEDIALIAATCAGSRGAAGQLVRRHQRFIYNIALKLVRDPDDAADLTQEVLVKMLTKLSQFESKSSFRTWLYRIVMNHFLSTQRRKAEKEIYSFSELGVYVDDTHNNEEMTGEEQDEYKDHIVTVRNKCMASTLLCLDREQRIILILGAVFNLRSPVAAQLLYITPENFRKQLSRAKHDLFQFMDDKCGLINPGNPCRCHKKTKGFIKEGKVDAETVRFTREAQATIASATTEKNQQLDHLMEGKYLRLFTDQPYEELPEELLVDKNILDLFLLN